MPPRCVLVGLPGSGKSVVARRVARRLGVSVIDTDRMLGGPEKIAAAWRSDGEEAFRVRELEVLARALTADGVVATGGGVVTTPEGRRLLGESPCVWLHASPEYLARRASTHHRPVLGDDALTRLTELSAQRSSWYEDVARETVDAARPLADVVNDVVLIVMGWDACG